MSRTIFSKRDGSISSVKDNLADNISLTTYPEDQSRGGFTFFSGNDYVSARYGKDHRLISYGFGDGRNMTYFGGKDNNQLKQIGQF
jgi:peptidoglycan hydrolase-like amidase